MESRKEEEGSDDDERVLSATKVLPTSWSATSGASMVSTGPTASREAL